MPILSHGDAIGDWTLDAPLGQGGFATVWRARAPDGRVGALKVLQDVESAHENANSLERRDEQRARLRREAKALADLDHPNVVGLIDVVDGPRLAMVTDLVDGPTLAEWMRGGPHPEPVLDAVFEGILDGVEAAHARGWVHRDLKPANILLERSDPPRPRVVDFGLAHLADATRLTRSGSVLGTPSYMAPEQVRDPSRVDPSADLFALGAILFELWCDRPAFLSPDMAATLQAASAGHYPNPRVLRPDLPDPIALAIAGALEPDSTARIPDCATLRAVLRGERSWTLPDRQTAPTTLVLPPGEASQPPPAARWLGVGAAVLVAIAVAGVALVSAPTASAPTSPIPTVSNTASVQSDFEAAWTGWLEGELTEALEVNARVVAAEPDRAWPHLLDGVLHGFLRHEDDAHEAIERTAARIETDTLARDTAASDLLDALQTDIRGTRSDVWTTLADAHPDDTMVQTLSCLQLGEDRAAVRTCRRAEAAGQVPLLHYLQARESLIQGDLDSTDDALTVLLRARPRHVGGTLLRVDWLQARGRFAEALSEAERAVGLAPELPDALLARASVRADLGDLQAARVDFEAAKSRATGADRVLAISQEAQVELGLGRATRPLQLLREASDAAETEGRWGDVVFAQTRLGWLGWYLEDAAQLDQTRATLGRAAAAVGPETPQGRALHAHQVYLAGMAGIVRQDATATGEARRELQSLDIEEVATIERETAVDLLWAYELAFGGDPDRLIHVASRWEFCEAQADGGRVLQRLGHHTTAVARLKTATEICGHTGIDRFFQFIALQGLATDAIRTGDRASEQHYRREMARLWPEMETPHPRVTADFSP